MSYDTDKIWRCTCGWTHFLSIQGIDNDNYLHIEGIFGPTTLREKFRSIYEIFRRGHYDTWLGIRLDAKTASEIRDELNKFIERKETS